MKKRKHRRKAWKIVLAVLAVVILFAAIVVFGFRTRSIEVEGNEYYGESSILAWIENDKLSVNTLYLFLKYDYLGADVPTAVESMTVSLKNPWTVHVTVREKEMLGYVDYDGAFLYFDRDGTACLRTKEVLDGVPHIEGSYLTYQRWSWGACSLWRTAAYSGGSWMRLYILQNTALSRTGSSVLTAVSHCISAAWKYCSERIIMKRGSHRWNRS